MIPFYANAGVTLRKNDIVYGKTTSSHPELNCFRRFRVCGVTESKVILTPLYPYSRAGVTGILNPTLKRGFMDVEINYYYYLCFPNPEFLPSLPFSALSQSCLGDFLGQQGSPFPSPVQDIIKEYYEAPEIRQIDKIRLGSKVIFYDADWKIALGTIEGLSVTRDSEDWTFFIRKGHGKIGMFSIEHLYCDADSMHPPYGWNNVDIEFLQIFLCLLESVRMKREQREAIKEMKLLKHKFERLQRYKYLTRAKYKKLTKCQQRMKELRGDWNAAQQCYKEHKDMENKVFQRQIEYLKKKFHPNSTFPLGDLKVSFKDLCEFVNKEKKDSPVPFPSIPFDDDLPSLLPAFPSSLPSSSSSSSAKTRSKKRNRQECKENNTGGGKRERFW